MALRFLKGGLSSKGYETKQVFEFYADASYANPQKGDHVSIQADGEVVLAADGAYIHGRIDVAYKPEQGKTRLSVDLLGQRMEVVLASAAITAGARVVSAGNGKFRAYVPGTDEPSTVIGFSVAGATGNNDPFELLYR